MDDIRERVAFAIAAVSTALLLIGCTGLLLAALYMALRSFWGF